MPKQQDTDQTHQLNWLSEAHSWIHTVLENYEIKSQGSIEEVHNRAWSTVLAVSTTDGRYFFKASSDILIHEAVLTDYLTNAELQNVPEILEVDTKRGWILMRDGGKRLRENLIAKPDMKRWEELLPLYARLQIKLTNHADKLKKIGVPDRSLERLPHRFEQILNEKRFFRIDMKDGLTAKQYQKLRDLLPVVRQKTRELGSYNILESINHGDLHDGNIFYNNGKYTFFDWGDATIAYPFFSLRTAYVSAEVRFNLEENHPSLNRLRDAYLIPWREFESEKRLLKAFSLAQELWAISSFFSWYITIANLNEAERAEYRHVFPSLSHELLDSIKA